MTNSAKQGRRRGRKRPKQSQQRKQEEQMNQYWKPVTVQLPDPRLYKQVPQGHEFQVEDDEDHHREDHVGQSNNNSNNHYDNPKLQRQANKDLPVLPGEEIAFFYGLEVLDSTKYQLVPSTTTTTTALKGRKENSMETSTKNSTTTTTSSNTKTTNRLIIVPSSSSSYTNDAVSKSKRGANEGKSQPFDDLSTTSHNKKKKKKKRKKRKRAVLDEDSEDDDGNNINSSSNDDDNGLQSHSNKNNNKEPIKETTDEIRTMETTASSNEVHQDSPKQLPMSQQVGKQEGKNTKTKEKKAKEITMSNQEAMAITMTRKKERKEKRKEVGSSIEIATKENTVPQFTAEQQGQILQIQSNWSQATGGCILHERICMSLYNMGYLQPTPIQLETLSASILGRRNLVGAAPTGSGKTLAFLLPILQYLLDQQQEGGPITSSSTEDEDHDNNHHDSNTTTTTPTQALIITPTRELAVQIHTECDKLIPKQCVSLVGGIALVKQERLLHQIQPRIVIGTPGRLWAMISSGNYPSLSDLSQLRFLVLDEADRMVQKHCFPQLVQILEEIHSANPGDEGDDDDYSDEENDDDVVLGSLPGVRGEARVTMLTNDILRQMESHRLESAPEPIEAPDDEFELVDNDTGRKQDEEFDDHLFPTQRPPAHRQTFIYSATLTLPTMHTSMKGSNGKKKGKRPFSLEGPIAEILEQTRVMGETKLVDLSLGTSKHANANKLSSNGTNRFGGVQLPPGLHLEQIKCTQRHKDSHLYAYLLTTAPEKPSLVFCNSIAGVRRVGATLQKLGLPVRILHAHMQQRARFKAVESLACPKGRAVVVCSDVASRGLDIPSVSTVVHYDAPRSVDVFIHRSGRTARGVGGEAVGVSLSLVAPAEDKAHRIIAEAVQAKFSNVIMDGRLLTGAQTRTNLASKVVAAEELEQKTQSRNKWFQDMANEAGLEVDEYLVEDDSNRPPRELAQVREARKAKMELARLLAEPMKTQRFGKFMSSSILANSMRITPGAKKPT